MIRNSFQPAEAASMQSDRIIRSDVLQAEERGSSSPFQDELPPSQHFSNQNGGRITGAVDAATTAVSETSNSFASSSAAATQTRFSFYNADDFKVPVHNLGVVASNTPERLATTRQQPQPVSMTPPSLIRATTANTSHNSQPALSAERRHVPMLTSITDETNEYLHADPQHPLTTAMNGAASGPLASQLGSKSNPYEDAIKEALELLRKHRNPDSPSPANHHNRATTVAPPIRRVDLRHNSSEAVDPVDGYSSRTPREADRVLQSRGDLFSVGSSKTGAVEPFHPLSVSSKSSGLLPRGTTLPIPPDTPDSASSSLLGEAYQAEIEARRKQRQERMAKYASRLAELKQESDGGTTTTPHSTSSRRRTTTESVSGHRNNESSLTPSDRTTGSRNVAAAIQLEATAPKLAISREAVSMDGSVSSITATHKDDDVQRGVERVLLAILERANSSNKGGGTAGGSCSVTTESLEGSKTSSWHHPGEEEKKQSNSECAADETSLLHQAMSDLLLGTKSSSTSSAHRSFSPTIQPLVRDGSDLGLAIDVDDYDPIAASRSSDDAGCHFEVVHPEVDTSFGLKPSQNVSFLSQPAPPKSRTASPPTTTSLYLTELANTTDGIEAVASDSGMMSELDELVRKVSDRSNVALSHSESEHNILVVAGTDAVLPANSHQDDSIDQRVRRLLTTSNSNHEVDGDRRPRNRTNESDEDDSIENTSVDRTSTGLDAESSFDESILDGGDDGADDSDDSEHRHDTIDFVLGPLSKRVGGTTGVVLEPDLSTHETPSILESLSAAVSMVVSGNTAASSKSIGLFKDKFSSSGEVVVAADIEDSDSEANGLMRTLCAHLLPFGVNPSSKLLEKRPEWDESNPDEPGYRIVRLTRDQLHGIEDEFNRMVDALKYNSEQNLRMGAGSDEAFARDLQAAEDLLDREGERLKVQAEPLGAYHSSSSKIPDSPDRQSIVSADDDASAALPHFPGVKRAGGGEMGDLEFFHLPIIFKSHVTGFEPTKDLCLEPGNVVAGQYLVDGELGSAAFSTAYRCVDLNSQGSGPDGHEEVCLKVIKNTKDFFDQSLDEIKILELLRQTGKCREKCIVEMRTFFYHREHLIIVTELLRQNLFEFGKFIVDHDEEPYFTLPRLSFITRQVLIALDFVHSLGLVHSDVKPENILLGSYSRAQVKLIDFGSSCYLTDRQSSYIQSRSYRAPEVVLGLPYDGRIDIWSLGCVVAEMYTGEVTFQNDSIVSMLSRIEAICGPFPRHMIAQGRQSNRFFTKCGLLYERVQQQHHRRRRSSSRGGAGDDDDDTDSVSGSTSSTEGPAEAQQQHYDIFQPKITTLSSRLGFASNLLDLYDNSGKNSNHMPIEQHRQALFVDFVQQLLRIDPESRLTASQALQHPWMQYAATLTERDIHYPSI